MSNRDIYIRRISSRIGNTGKTAVRLYEYIHRTIEEKNLTEVLGELDYLVVLKKTKLEQDDYVGFLSFKDRDVHEVFVKKFNEPLLFAGREMVFEINFRDTSIQLQTENKKRFQDNLKCYSTKRYFNQTFVKTDENTELSEHSNEEPEAKKQKTSAANALDILNSKIPEFLNSVRKRTVEKPESTTEEFIPLLTVPSERVTKSKNFFEIKNKTLENRVKLLEAALVEKTLAVSKLESQLAEKTTENNQLKGERERLRKHLIAGLNMFEQ